uniref:Transmembrane protein 144 n=1 Tax=Brugia timori TaxID=42155 RepID=A0A0R3QJ10_9BILA
LGILHGLMMTPIAYIQDNDSNASPDVLDYVFPHFCAVFFSSTVYFIAYCVWMRDRIHAPAELILPSATYGILWCTGMILWFISNHLLSQTVSFPITTRLPSTIGVLLDVVFFKDIKVSYSFRNLQQNLI